MYETRTAPVTYLPGSGWVDRPTDLAPVLVGNDSCDVVVVGGGMGGMAAALRLAELGQDVVLLEAEICGWGASGRNAGYITQTLGSDPRIIKKFYADKARGLYRFAKHSVSFTESLIEDNKIDCDYDATGNVATATSQRALRKIEKTIKPNERVAVGDAEALGIPERFIGGMHIKVGGILNPGKLALGLREVVRASSVRVFEQTSVTDVQDTGHGVTVTTPGGHVRAGHAVLTVNAFMNGLSIAPRNLSTPVWVTAVETEPVSDAQLDAEGWTSRAPITTNHFVMQSFRTTARGTMVTTTRSLQAARHAQLGRLPRESVVTDIMRGVHERFPGLGELSPARVWGGWIGLTPSNMANVGQLTPNISYSMACNGHGLPQAPYLGTLLADHLAGEGMHDDLAAVWRETQRFMPGVVSPVTLRLGWAADRITDRLSGVLR
ncbi:FAD-dependent oxidoreductase [Nocardioides sp. AN3]